MNNLSIESDPMAAGVTPGVYDGISNEAYQRAPGISNSGLALVAQAPAIYYGRRLDPNRPPEREKPGQLDGTLAHCAILEPHAFDQRFVVGPNVNRNTKEWKAFVAANPGRIAIQAEQYDRAMGQARSVWGIADVADALRRGRPERSAWWIDEATGELCKVRPDFVAEYDAGDVLLDVKTFSSAEPGEFSRQIARKGYYRQDAMYTEGWQAASGRPVLGFVFVAVETEYPYAASAITLDPDAKAAGHAAFRAALDTYADCRRTDHWPGYTSAIEVVSLPRYITGV